MEIFKCLDNSKSSGDHNKILKDQKLKVGLNLQIKGLAISLKIFFGIRSVYYSILKIHVYGFDAFSYIFLIHWHIYQNSRQNQLFKINTVQLSGCALELLTFTPKTKHG